MPELSMRWAIQLYVTKKDKTAMGVLTQTLRMLDRPIATFQSNLITLPLGGLAFSAWQWLQLPYWYMKPQTDFWPGSDRKGSTGSQHLLRGDPHKWLSNSRIIQYQGLLCENPNLCIEPCQDLNLTTPSQQEKLWPTHDCKKVLEEVHVLAVQIPLRQDNFKSWLDCVYWWH